MKQVSELHRKQHFHVPSLDNKHGQVVDHYPNEAGTVVRWREKRPDRSFKDKAGTLKTVKGGWKWTDPIWVAPTIRVEVGRPPLPRKEVTS